MDTLLDKASQILGRQSHASHLNNIVRASSKQPSPLGPMADYLHHLPQTQEELTSLLRDVNPLNIVLSVVALYILGTILLPESVSKLTPTLAKARSPKCHAGNSYSFLPEEHPPVAQWTRYTPRTLAIHDGSAGKQGPILLAIEGRVFDVTKGSSFYGPGGPYGNFAGRDASRGMAKQSFDLDTLTPLDKPLDKLEDLTPSEV
jgi:membrane-associated progesterone receptor component